MKTAPPLESLVHETIYGSRKRLRWIVSKLKPTDRIAELGCGTGWMITRPLLQLGYDVHGYDLDSNSIAYGQQRLSELQLDPSRLHADDLAKHPNPLDVIIASEVFEHIPDSLLPGVFETVHRLLAPGGKLLVTVPNGYGWFEWEIAIYKRLRLDRFFESYPCRVLHQLKWEWLVRRTMDPHPNTLSPSPHVQFFTQHAIETLLRRQGFIIRGMTGSVLAAGPIASYFCDGLSPFMAVNGWLGSTFPSFATGFFLECERAGASNTK